MFQLSYTTKEGIDRKVRFISHEVARGTAIAELAAGSTKILITRVRRDVFSVDKKTMDCRLIAQNVLLSEAADAICNSLNEDFGILLMPTDRKSG